MKDFTMTASVVLLIVMSAGCSSSLVRLRTVSPESAPIMGDWETLQAAHDKTLLPRTSAPQIKHESSFSSRPALVHSEVEDALVSEDGAYAVSLSKNQLRVWSLADSSLRFALTSGDTSLPMKALFDDDRLVVVQGHNLKIYGLEKGVLREKLAFEPRWSMGKAGDLHRLGPGKIAVVSPEDPARCAPSPGNKIHVAAFDLDGDSPSQPSVTVDFTGTRDGSTGESVELLKMTPCASDLCAVVRHKEWVHGRDRRRQWLGRWKAQGAYLALGNVNEPTARIDMADPDEQIIFSDDGRWLVVDGLSYDVTTGATGDEVGHVVAWNREGPRVVLENEGRDLVVFRADGSRGKKLLLPDRYHPVWGHQVRFTPGADTVAVVWRGSFKSLVGLFDSESGDPQGHPVGVPHTIQPPGPAHVLLTAQGLVRPDLLDPFQPFGRVTAISASGSKLVVTRNRGERHHIAAGVDAFELVDLERQKMRTIHMGGKRITAAELRQGTLWLRASTPMMYNRFAHDLISVNLEEGDVRAFVPTQEDSWIDRADLMPGMTQALLQVKGPQLRHKLYSLDLIEGDVAQWARRTTPESFGDDPCGFYRDDSLDESVIPTRYRDGFIIPCGNEVSLLDPITGDTTVIAHIDEAELLLLAADETTGLIAVTDEFHRFHMFREDGGIQCQTEPLDEIEELLFLGEGELLVTRHETGPLRLFNSHDCSVHGVISWDEGPDSPTAMEKAGEHSLIVGTSFGLIHVFSMTH